MADLEAAVAHHRAGRLAEAEAGYAEVLAAEPGNVRALHNLGLLLVAGERLDEAAAMLAGQDDPQIRALRIKVERARGLARLRDGQDAAAEAAFGVAIALGAEGEALAELNLGRGAALANLDRREEALACFHAAASSPSLRYDALVQAALSLVALNRRDEALASLDQAIALKPDDPRAYYRRAFIRLARGEFEAGWRDFERRLEVDEFLAISGVITPAIRAGLTVEPTREDLAGRRVLLVGEQGIGDQVMFASLIPDLARTARDVTCACDTRLVRLFSSSFPDVRFLPVPGSTARLADYEVSLAMGSLARLYRNRREDFPGAPYLAPRTEVRETWQARLGPKPAGLRIGVSWRGGSARSGGARRSLSLDQLAPLFALPGCEFVSLQYGDVRGEVGDRLRLFPADEIDDFEDLAGLVRSLDLVVSVQTALVHLCGALGQTCLALLPSNPEWRYGLEGAAMPWYGSVRLFRQPQAGDWGPVIADVTANVKARLA